MDNTPQSKQEFSDFLDGLSEYYGREPESKTNTEFYHAALAEYDLNQIKHAAMIHVRDKKRGQFFPKIADFLAILDQDIEKPRPAEVVGMARKPTCPFGVIARVIIGSYDLKNSIDFNYLCTRAHEVLQEWDSIKERAILGDYSEHELLMMKKFGVSPARPLIPGMLEPSVEAKRLISRRCHDALKKEQLLLEAPPKETKDYSEQISAKVLSIVSSVRV